MTESEEELLNQIGGQLEQMFNSGDKNDELLQTISVYSEKVYIEKSLEKDFSSGKYNQYSSIFNQTQKELCFCNINIVTIHKIKDELLNGVNCVLMFKSTFINDSLTSMLPTENLSLIKLIKMFHVILPSKHIKACIK